MTLNPSIPREPNGRRSRNKNGQPGRPPGSPNKSNSKTAVRLRVREFRARQAEETEEIRESQQRLFNDMRNEGLLFFGEKVPTINCINISEEIDMARIWARLLNVRDIQPGDNQRAYILEVMQAWCSADCPLLHVESQTLSNRTVDIPNIEEYVWPENSDTPYQIQTNEVTPDVK
jgi:hypothetical protein